MRVRGREMRSRESSFGRRSRGSSGVRWILSSEVGSEEIETGLVSLSKGLCHVSERAF